MGSRQDTVSVAMEIEHVWACGVLGDPFCIMFGQCIIIKKKYLRSLSEALAYCWYSMRLSRPGALTCLAEHFRQKCSSLDKSEG